MSDETGRHTFVPTFADGVVRAAYGTLQRFEHVLLDEVDWHQLKAGVWELERKGYELVSLAVVHDPKTEKQYYVGAMKRPIR